MIVLKDIGRFAELPDIAMDIIQGNLPALQAEIQAGRDMEKEIVLSKHTALSPLDLALVSGQMEVVKLLVEHGINLNFPGIRLFCGRSGTAVQRWFVTCTPTAPSRTSLTGRGRAHTHKPIMAIRPIFRLSMSWDWISGSMAAPYCVKPYRTMM
jgi:hypothetical protein